MLAITAADAKMIRHSLMEASTLWMRSTLPDDDARQDQRPFVAHDHLALKRSTHTDTLP